MIDYPLALGLTVFAESTVATAWARGRGPIDRLLFVVFVVGLNLVTHPLAWTVLGVVRLPPGITFVAVEVTVVLAEALALRCLPGVTGRDALGVAIAMNVASALLAVLVT